MTREIKIYFLLKAMRVYFVFGFRKKAINCWEKARFLITNRDQNTVSKMEADRGLI
jgi:hypothetical protein